MAPASAEWTDPDLETMLIIDTEVSVLGESPDIPGRVELPVFDGVGDQQEQLDLYDIVKIEATLTVTSDMPLPIQIQIVFGGLGYQTAPRTWTLRSDGTYSTSAYFLVSGEGNKTIGAKVWVKWLPTGELPSATETNTVLEQVVVRPLP